MSHILNNIWTPEGLCKVEQIKLLLQPKAMCKVFQRLFIHFTVEVIQPTNLKGPFSIPKIPFYVYAKCDQWLEYAYLNFMVHLNI